MSLHNNINNNIMKNDLQYLECIDTYHKCFNNYNYHISGILSILGTLHNYNCKNIYNQCLEKYKLQNKIL